MKSATEATDIGHMGVALSLARRALGRAWPNPAVGCVLVRPEDSFGGRVVGRGWTAPGGRPHGESAALARAGRAARGATAYVSLEPCDHHGKTPPCTEALIESGISRVVIPLEDPDPRVSGRGVARLRRAGIAVDVGLCAAEARESHAGFFLRITEGRPLVTLKLATSLDGRIATGAGASRWITGAAARARVHGLRANHDAVMVGVGTAIADNPDLTCRLPGLADRSPVRVVMDSHMRLPLDSRLVAGAGATPTWLIALADGPSARRAVLVEAGVRVIAVAADSSGRVDVAAALTALGTAGLTRLLVEGGGDLAASLLRAGLVDRMVWVRAPMVIGGDGVSAVAELGVSALADAPTFEPVTVDRVATDLLETFRRRP